MDDRLAISAEGATLWKGIFGNDRPVSVEIGSGRGEFLLASAQAWPTRNFFGIELSRRRAEQIASRLDSARLKNARILRADAKCLIETLPDACVATYIIQFPDPWWKRRHHRRRLLSGPFVAALVRTLAPGGTIELLTDVEDYFLMAQRLFNARNDLEPQSPEQNLHDASTTFANKARARNARVHTSVHRRLAL